MSAARAQRPTGYTIIEMLVVMAVLSVLATLALPLAELTAKRSKERELRAALWEIRQAIDRYKQATDEGRIAIPSGASGYPKSLSELVDGVRDQKSGTTLYFLRRIPADPMSTAEQEGAWLLRSYQSSADNPQPGSDVYDVRSRSAGLGINGVPYAQW
jgi:general secretion pathway protein G